MFNQRRNSNDAMNPTLKSSRSFVSNSPDHLSKSCNNISPLSKSRAYNQTTDPVLLKRSEQVFNAQSAQQKMKIFNEMEKYIRDQGKETEQIIGTSAHQSNASERLQNALKEKADGKSDISANHPVEMNFEDAELPINPYGAVGQKIYKQIEDHISAKSKSSNVTGRRSRAGRRGKQTSETSVPKEQDIDKKSNVSADRSAKRYLSQSSNPNINDIVTDSMKKEGHNSAVRQTDNQQIENQEILEQKSVHMSSKEEESQIVGNVDTSQLSAIQPYPDHANTIIHPPGNDLNLNQTINGPGNIATNVTEYKMTDQMVTIGDEFIEGNTNKDFNISQSSIFQGNNPKENQTMKLNFNSDNKLSGRNLESSMTFIDQSSLEPNTVNQTDQFNIDNLDPQLQQQLKPLLANLNLEEAKFLQSQLEDGPMKQQLGLLTQYLSHNQSQHQINSQSSVDHKDLMSVQKFVSAPNANVNVDKSPKQQQAVFQGSFQNKGMKRPVANSPKPDLNQQQKPLNIIDQKNIVEQQTPKQSQPFIKNENVPPLDLNNSALRKLHQTTPSGQMTPTKGGYQQMDMNVIGQYETALQLMNSEIQKLLISNDTIQKQNQLLKSQNEQNALRQQPNQQFGMNENIWLNSQLKDAKAQLQDLRRVNQNLHIEIRALNDKRNLECKELGVAQERLAESIVHSRNLMANLDQIKIDLTNQVNTKQGLQKVNEQLEMQIQVLNKELDMSEQQKLKQFSVQQQLQNQNNKIKDGLQSLLDQIKQKHELYQDLSSEGPILAQYETLLYEIKNMGIDSFDYELPPCSIQTSIYKPFQIPIQNPNFANPMAQNNVLQQLLSNMMRNSNQGGVMPNIGMNVANLFNQQNQNQNNGLYQVMANSNQNMPNMRNSYQSSQVPPNGMQAHPGSAQMNTTQSFKNLPRPFDMGNQRNAPVNQTMDLGPYKNNQNQMGTPVYKQPSYSEAPNQSEKRNKAGGNGGIPWISEQSPGLRPGANNAMKSPAAAAGPNKANVANLKMTLNGLLEERRSLNQRIRSTPHNDDFKFDLDILNNNIETVQQKLTNTQQQN